MANSFVCGRKNRDNAHRTFVIYLARWKLPKCVWTSQETAFVFGRVNCENTPKTFFINLIRRKLPKCVSTANSFIFGRINREIAPRTFLNCTQNYKLASGEFFNCIWTFFHRSLLFIHAVIWERLKSWKYVAHIFAKITKLCFVKFCPVEEIASKFASADFQTFCRLGSKKSAESSVFLGLEGTPAMRAFGGSAHSNFAVLRNFSYIFW